MSRRPEVGRTGARFARPTGEDVEPVDRVADPAVDGPAAGDGFPIVVRGYERRHVDDHVARLRETVRTLRRELEGQGRRLRRAVERADTLVDENQQLRAALAERGPAAEGYGARAEKLLRLAEAEAAEIRTDASRESRTMVEQARVQAELYRHESEQALIARSRELDQELRRRTTALDERERQSAEQIAAGRDESARLREAAETAVARLHAQARREAELITGRARVEAGQARQEARTELNRIGALEAQVYAELDRLSRMICRQLSPEVEPEVEVVA